MADWFDLAAAIPGLRGTTVHVLPARREAEVRKALAKSAFSFHVLEGRLVSDDASFFRQVKRAFRFAPHFGKNWDALGDALGDLADRKNRRVALLWLEADRSLAQDAQTVVDAVLVFSQAGEDLAGEEPPTQLEVFLLGEARAMGRG